MKTPTWIEPVKWPDLRKHYTTERRGAAADDSILAARMARYSSRERTTRSGDMPGAHVPRHCRRRESSIHSPLEPRELTILLPSLAGHEADAPVVINLHLPLREMLHALPADRGEVSSWRLLKQYRLDPLHVPDSVL